MIRTLVTTVISILYYQLMIRMTEEEMEKYFRDFILWQHEGLDIKKQQCLFINFGVNIKSESPQIRRIVVISHSVLMPKDDERIKD